ncbi:GTPase Era [Buchnera aphidicola (Aphis helianthi)]|uniref:GTPase Era n=1 Tax=Buchnera aphidicola (Aphis helianthi) TaxID=2315802 RepID=A0A4D6XRD0_9GAMM|nr:GTPase Era [Buchnera aphidicola]QCI17080.1 GTPase Era [Buchnera aphidicola (Aphis helianthi)]
MNKKEKYCGYIAIVGRPNVGKSTLINEIVKKNISITSKKKNTTQSNITGIKTNENYQSIYIDTPGVHCYDIKTLQIIKNTNLIIFLMDRNIWKKEDEIIFNQIKQMNIPIIYTINKIDKLINKNNILSYIDILFKKTNATEIIPVSVKKRSNIILLEKIVEKYLPKNQHIFPKTHITTNSFYFSISEIIRKQLILFLRDELPSILTVKIESIEYKFKKLHINAIIYVKNKRQKKIVIGSHGEIIKKISMLSRYYIEKEINKKVYLLIWVIEKIK